MNAGKPTGHEPVRCYGCGRVMRPKFYRMYHEGVANKCDIDELFMKIGLGKRFCCRRGVMSDMSLIYDWAYLAMQLVDPTLPPVPAVPLSSLPATDPIIVQFRTKGRFPSKPRGVEKKKRFIRKPAVQLAKSLSTAPQGMMLQSKFNTPRVVELSP